MIRYSLLAALLLMINLSGCSTWEKLDDTEKGAVIGGGTGVAVGSAVAPGLGGAAVGGAIGAVGGGLIGNEVERRKKNKD